MIARSCNACSTSRAKDTRINTKSNVVSRNSQKHRSLIKTHSIIDPSSMGTEETNQAISVVATSILFGGLAIVQGLKSEPKPCPSCATSGGEACIFCNGTGRRETPIEITKKDRTRRLGARFNATVSDGVHRLQRSRYDSLQDV